jgi:archaellum component FlaF (FlaF/FlaG flagellin family)
MKGKIENFFNKIKCAISQSVNEVDAYEKAQIENLNYKPLSISGRIMQITITMTFLGCAVLGFVFVFTPFDPISILIHLIPIHLSPAPSKIPNEAYGIFVLLLIAFGIVCGLITQENKKTNMINNTFKKSTQEIKVEKVKCLSNKL